MRIRQAKPEDAEKLLAIYKPYVEKTAITFEYAVPTVEEFKQRICHTLEKYPYLVAEENGAPVGYCYVSAFKGRAAYDWSVETSIYVKEDCRKSGIGRALYQALEEVLSLQHVCNLCACIAYPNPPSIRFHEAFGYVTAAHFHKSGFKSGKWYDMVWLEKTLTKHEIPPLPFLPSPEISDTYWSR